MSCHKLKDWNSFLACVGFPVIKEVVWKIFGERGARVGVNIFHMGYPSKFLYYFSSSR